MNLNLTTDAHKRSKSHPSRSVKACIATYVEYRAMRGATPQTITDIKRYLDDFRVWLKRRGTRKVSAVDATVLQDYQRHVFDYRKKNGDPLAPASKLAKLVPLRAWLRWLAAKHGIGLGLADLIELPSGGQRLPRGCSLHPRWRPSWPVQIPGRLLAFAIGRCSSCSTRPACAVWNSPSWRWPTSTWSGASFASGTAKAGRIGVYRLVRVRMLGSPPIWNTEGPHSSDLVPGLDCA